MGILEYDLGIHIEDITEYLNDYGIIKIIGFERSGKSTLAEILRCEIESKENIVLLQNATQWLYNLNYKKSTVNSQAPSIDPDLTETIAYIEKVKCQYWIIDDAEILLAYASENILKTISHKIRDRVFFIILIRNRFVLEHSGWFRDRESLLNLEIPKFHLKPLSANLAVNAAKTIFHEDHESSKIDWLVKMSGGIPGLMSDLAPFANNSILEENKPGLVRRAKIKREQLKINEPMRYDIIKALSEKILPPLTMLSNRAQAELGDLKLAGMIYEDYVFRDNPFCGQFWDFVIGFSFQRRQIPINITDTAINIAILLEDKDLAVGFFDMFELNNTDSIELSMFFSLCLYCEQEYPTLIRPLNRILAENLGSMQLYRILKEKGIKVNHFSINETNLAELLIEYCAII